MQIDSSAFFYGLGIAKDMKAAKPFDTVACTLLETYGVLASMIVAAAGGDHLEIGVWHGASAIVAAKTKQECGLDGNVVGLDDFCGYESSRNPNAARMETTKSYFREYGVSDRIELIIGNTFDFPADKFTDRRFVSAFIDGNHTKDQPYKDFLLIEPLVERYIMFDDCDDNHPAVMEAVGKIANDKFCDWRAIYGGYNSAIVERISNERN
jgi:predicted O-methyltransferase YrrM